MSRKPLIAGNWKMNLNHYEAIALVQKIAFSLPDKYYDRVDVAVIPPFTDLRSVQTLVDGDKLRLTYGAQDLSPHDSGAYTGDVSGAFLAKLGCSYVVVGHSERRTYHNEDDALVAAKAATALKHGLTPIVCIGEHLDVREAEIMWPTTSNSCVDRWPGYWPSRSAVSSSPTNRSGRSAPGGWPAPPTPRRCVRRSERVGLVGLAEDCRYGAGALRRLGERQKRRRHRGPG